MYTYRACVCRQMHTLLQSAAMDMPLPWDLHQQHGACSPSGNSVVQIPGHILLAPRVEHKVVAAEAHIFAAAITLHHELRSSGAGALSGIRQAGVLPRPQAHRQLSGVVSTASGQLRGKFVALWDRCRGTRSRPAEPPSHAHFPAASAAPFPPAGSSAAIIADKQLSSTNLDINAPLVKRCTATAPGCRATWLWATHLVGVGAHSHRLELADGGRHLSTVKWHHTTRKMASNIAGSAKKPQSGITRSILNS